MIRVERQPEPAAFDELVRRPGKKFLRVTPNPTTAEWEKHNYWRKIRAELRAAYRRICAYHCRYVVSDELSHCDHFKPKKSYPNDAYEWNNYRFVCALPNTRKGTQAILDPFEIENGWFAIDFPSLQVVPSNKLSGDRRQSVLDTIAILKLNDERTCESREEAVKHFCLLSRDSTPSLAMKYAMQYIPFIAMEIQRAGLMDSLRDVMRYKDADLEELPG